VKRILFYISIISLLFIECSRENDDNHNQNIIVGGLYIPYTEVVQCKSNSTINISDSIFQFNLIEASYYSYKPTANQNVFVINFIDTLSSNRKSVEIDIFTQFVKPEDFFKKGSVTIDSLMITSTSVRENFFNTNAILTWDTAYFKDFSFKGKGFFELIDTLKSISEPSVFYPKQGIKFEFK
jgi:hypothetical protein